MDAFGFGMIQVLVGVGEGIGWVVGKVWRAYARILNLPILVGAVLDGVAGVFFGAGMLASQSFGTWALGVLLTGGGGVFAAASVVTWVAKVRDEREDAEHRLRYPKPMPMIGREPRGLGPHPHTPS